MSHTHTGRMSSLLSDTGGTDRSAKCIEPENAQKGASGHMTAATRSALGQLPRPASLGASQAIERPATQ